MLELSNNMKCSGYIDTESSMYYNMCWMMVSLIECKNIDISWYNRCFHGLCNWFTIFIYKFSKIHNTREVFKHIKIGSKEQHTTACSLPSAGDCSNIILGVPKSNHKERGKFKDNVIKKKKNLGEEEKYFCLVIFNKNNNKN